jgi:hypothetical protein
MQNLDTLIHMRLVTQEEVIEAINECYLPNLELLSYSLGENNKTLSIYNHTAIDLSDIENMAKILSVPYKDDSPADLCATIDKMNRIYLKKYLTKEGFATLYPEEALYSAYGGWTNRQETPFVNAIWNRDCSNLNRKILLKDGSKIFFWHGHDESDKTRDNIINTDENNRIGKFLEWNKGDNYNNASVFKIYYTYEKFNLE